MVELGELFGNTRAALLAPRTPVEIDADARLAEALTLMQREEVGCLVVVDAGRMAGILTERDIVEHCFHPDVDGSAPVHSVMRHDPPVIGPQDSVETALAILDRRRVRYIPIVDAAGRAHAVVTARAILDFLAESARALILNQAPEPTRPARQREGG